MSRHQLQPTCDATAMCANDLRLASAALHAPTLPPNSRLSWVTSGLCYSTSTFSGTAPSCLTMFSLSSLGSSAFGMRSAMMSSFLSLRMHVGVYVRVLVVRHEGAVGLARVMAGFAGQGLS